MRTLSLILMLFLTTLGPSLVIAFVGYGAVKALGRNPSAASRILLSMIFSFVFAEAIAVIALLVIYNLFR
ncbi:MAG: hypothetical protein A3K83_07420 [Omnitrophica WOR_2 bacterium RBG_13_44_8b]|nr:MAG: hypothetical protein A3K83_07420 [Omnitrophica WOR_2 bacterium RBG_13_44_8b]